MITNPIEKRLDDIEQILINAKDVFNPREAAKYIGISLSTLYKLTSSGTIPFSKPNGKLIYFCRKQLNDWMLSNMTSSAQQKDADAHKYLLNN